ncbi:hypothetical protein HN51_027778, partial [Arachis hypogaea]
WLGAVEPSSSSSPTGIRPHTSSKASFPPRSLQLRDCSRSGSNHHVRRLVTFEIGIPGEGIGRGERSSKGSRKWSRWD